MLVCVLALQSFLVMADQYVFYPVPRFLEAVRDLATRDAYVFTPPVAAAFFRGKPRVLPLTRLQRRPYCASPSFVFVRVSVQRSTSWMCLK